MKTSQNLTQAILTTIKNGKTDRFWSVADFDGLASPLPVDRVLSSLSKDKQLRSIRRGLYWYGRKTPFGMSRPSNEQLIAYILGTNGIGPAGLSAANDLGLTTQVPALDIVAVPRRAPRPIPAVRFVDRSARQGRVTARLRASEVALLEVLSDWDRVVEVDDDTATRQLNELINSGAVRVDRLVQASPSEPPATRERLRGLLRSAGYAASADDVPAARSVSVIAAVA